MLLKEIREAIQSQKEISGHTFNAYYSYSEVREPGTPPAPRQLDWENSRQFDNRYFRSRSRSPVGGFRKQDFGFDVHTSRNFEERSMQWQNQEQFEFSMQRNSFSFTQQQQQQHMQSNWDLPTNFLGNKSNRNTSNGFSGGDYNMSMRNMQDRFYDGNNGRDCNEDSSRNNFSRFAESQGFGRNQDFNPTQDYSLFQNSEPQAMSFQNRNFDFNHQERNGSVERTALSSQGSFWKSRDSQGHSSVPPQKAHQQRNAFFCRNVGPQTQKSGQQLVDSCDNESDSEDKDSEVGEEGAGLNEISSSDEDFGNTDYKQLLHKYGSYESKLMNVDANDDDIKRVLTFGYKKTKKVTPAAATLRFMRHRKTFHTKLHIYTHKGKPLMPYGFIQAILMLHDSELFRFLPEQHKKALIKCQRKIREANLQAFYNRLLRKWLKFCKSAEKLEKMNKGLENMKGLYFSKMFHYCVQYVYNDIKKRAAGLAEPPSRPITRQPWSDKIRQKYTKRRY